MSAHSSQDGTLSREQVESFVENGFLLLRGALPRDQVLRLASDTLAGREPSPTIYVRQDGKTQPVDDPRLDLRDRDTWPQASVVVETHRRLPIRQFAPRLWHAITALIGPLYRVERDFIGGQWLLKGSCGTPTAPPLRPEYYTKFKWHIDSPGPRTQLDGRKDALILLALWSDVDPGQGGPLFSGQSLDRVVALLEASPEGVNTRAKDWARPLIEQCTDVTELTGRAGDVVLTHGLALHAGQLNFSKKIRLLENVTVVVTAPLDYTHDNLDPSPVERCVLRRLARPRRRPVHPGAELAERMVRTQPDYFLPQQRQWQARALPAHVEAARCVDRALSRDWLTRTGRHVRDVSSPGRERALVSIALIRNLFVNQRVMHSFNPESVKDLDFADLFWSRLIRGYTNCEGQNYALALLLRESFDDVQLFETACRAGPAGETEGDHILVRVRTDQGWFFADAWSSGTLFYVAELDFGKPFPGIPEHGELDRTGPLRHHGIFDRKAYLRGRVERTPPIEACDLSMAIRSAQAFTLEPFDDARLDLWREYLTVRLQHVAGRATGLAKAYGELLARHRPGGMTRRLIESHRERAERLSDIL